MADDDSKLLAGFHQAMLGIYTAVVLTAGAYFAAQMRDIGMLVGYPLAIAVMHFAWGGAFLWGLMTGAACWRADGVPAGLSGGPANSDARFNPLA